MFKIIAVLAVALSTQGRGAKLEAEEPLDHIALALAESMAQSAQHLVQMAAVQGEPQDEVLAQSKDPLSEDDTLPARAAPLPF